MKMMMKKSIKEYNKLFGEDKELENIVLSKENKIEDIKVKKEDELKEKNENIQKEDSSDNSIRESQKILLKNVFKIISTSN
jgi:hypothetical protein